MVPVEPMMLTRFTAPSPSPQDRADLARRHSTSPDRTNIQYSQVGQGWQDILAPPNDATGYQDDEFSLLSMKRAGPLACPELRRRACAEPGRSGPVIARPTRSAVGAPLAS